MNKVKIMVTGQRPREVFVRKGEDFVALLKRLDSKSWPLMRAEQWYRNNKALGIRFAPIERLRITPVDGDVFAGTPRVSGSRILGSTPTCHLRLPGRALFPLAFKIGDRLSDAIWKAPKDIRDAAAPVTAWGQSMRDRPNRLICRSSSNVALFDGILVEALRTHDWKENTTDA